MPERVVAVLGRGVVPADLPILRADDLGALRGDGIFESAHVRGGRPWLLDEHLARMAVSAARLELDLPAAGQLADLAEQALDGWPAGVEGALRIVVTRGGEDGGPVTVANTVGGPDGISGPRVRTSRSIPSSPAGHAAAADRISSTRSSRAGRLSSSRAAEPVSRSRCSSAMAA